MCQMKRSIILAGSLTQVRGGLMIPVALLIALMLLTWAAAVVSVYVASDETSGKRPEEIQDQDYYDAA